MDNTQQLPDEVKIEIDNKAGEYADQMHGYVGDDIHVGYIASATEYATKLYPVEQENKKLIQVLLETEQAKRDELQKAFETARAFLEKVISRHEGVLIITDPDLYNEIKTFLDGK